MIHALTSTKHLLITVSPGGHATIAILGDLFKFATIITMQPVNQTVNLSSQVWIGSSQNNKMMG